MATPVGDELRALRARAYGPDADIQHDPVAQRRLAKLEDDRRRPPLAVVPTPEPDDPADEEGTPTEPESAASRTEGMPRLARFWRRRGIRRGVWIAAVVVAALVGAGVAWGAAVVAPVATSSGLRQTATLSPSTTAVVPVGFFGRTEGAPVFEWEGLTLFVSRLDYGEGDEGETCLDIIPTERVPAPSDYDPGAGIEGPIYTGCSAGAFPATVAFRLDDARAADIDGLPEGRAVQFVLRGDRVGVYLDRG